MLKPPETLAVDSCAIMSTHLLSPGGCEQLEGSSIPIRRGTEGSSTAQEMRAPAAPDGLERRKGPS
jgi:hypothetical protein